MSGPGDAERRGVRRGGRVGLEARVGRILSAVTYLGVGVIGLGTAAMVAAGVSPLDAPPVLSLRALADSLGALRPEGLLWLGIVILVAGPVLRVVSSGVGYSRGGERRMVLVSVGILGVIAASVVVGLAAAVSAGA